MSNTMVRNGAGNAPARTQTLEDFVQANMASLQQVASRSIDVSRLARLIIAQVQQNPNLRNCKAASIFRAMQQAAEVGLEPGNALGHSYLVPYKDEAQFIIGYRGFLELARRSGQIATLVAFPVYEGDEFEIELGADPKIRHIPNLDVSHDVAKLRLVYAVAKGKDGTLYPDVMTRADIDKIRSRSRSGNSGPWVTDYVEMARKTVVRRLAKYLPLSLEMATAVSIDEDGDLGPIDVISSSTVVPESHQIPSQAQPAIEAAPAAKSNEVELRKRFRAKAAAMGYEGDIRSLVASLLGYMPAAGTADIWQIALDRTETEWRAAIEMLESAQQAAPAAQASPAPQPAAAPEPVTAPVAAATADEDDRNPFEDDESAEDGMDLSHLDVPAITDDSPAAIPGAFA